MRDLAILFLHLLTIMLKLLSPGGARSIVAESLLVKHQLLIINRSRKRGPNLRTMDRVIAGLCTLLMTPGLGLSANCRADFIGVWGHH